MTVEPSSIADPTSAPPPEKVAVGTRRADWVLRAIIGVVAVLVVAGGTYLLHAANTPKQLVGGAIATPPVPASNFSGTDQLGQSVQLSQFKGKPVALTFIYTHCPDVCPLISANMHQAYGKLGNAAQNVALLAVTVDPENDTVPQIRAYSDQVGLTNQWHFLTNARPQLEAIWRSYGILSRAVNAQGQPITPTTLAAGAAQAPSPDEVEHSAPVFLIDKAGNIRAMLPTDFTSDTLVTDLQVLLAES